MSDPSLSPKEVAQHLGFCSKTVLKLIKLGKIQPIYRINARVIRIPESSVKAYLKRCKDLDASPPRHLE
jgi:excisionase family DNA binding protein